MSRFNFDESTFSLRDCDEVFARHGLWRDRRSLGVNSFNLADVLLTEEKQLTTLQASHESLVTALEETAHRTSYGTGEGCWCNVEDIDSPTSDHKPFCQQIRTALTNAAKLAPTKAEPCGYCGGTGEVACSSTSYMACPKCSTRTGGSGCER